MRFIRNIHLIRPQLSPLTDLGLEVQAAEVDGGHLGEGRSGPSLWVSLRHCDSYLCQTRIWNKSREFRSTFVISIMKVTESLTLNYNKSLSLTINLNWEYELQDYLQRKDVLSTYGDFLSTWMKTRVENLHFDTILYQIYCIVMEKYWNNLDLASARQKWASLFVMSINDVHE